MLLLRLLYCTELCSQLQDLVLLCRCGGSGLQGEILSLCLRRFGDRERDLEEEYPRCRLLSLSYILYVSCGCDGGG
jgi:hypothetical protein